MSATALPALNDWLLQQAGAAGLVSTWHGLRLVAADASTLRFGHCASHVPRAANANQIAFGLYLPGAEVMLAASLHSVHENERQMLFQHIDRLSSVSVQRSHLPSDFLAAHPCCFPARSKHAVKSNLHTLS